MWLCMHAQHQRGSHCPAVTVCLDISPCCLQRSPQRLACQQGPDATSPAGQLGLQGQGGSELHPCEASRQHRPAGGSSPISILCALQDVNVMVEEACLMTRPELGAIFFGVLVCSHNVQIAVLAWVFRARLAFSDRGQASVQQNV